MKLNLITLLYLTGVPFALPIQDWSQVAPTLIKMHMSWPVAQKYCKENYLDLFTIRTLSNQVQLSELLIRHNALGPVWTGLYNDLDSWYWSYNHLPLKNISLRSWCAGYPSHAYGENVCVAIYTDGHWLNQFCYTARSFLCYDANNSPADRIVGYASPALTWYEAQIYCRTYHTDLATTMTQSDISTALQILTDLGYTSAWIGLTRDTWKWSDQTEPSFLPWLSGQPDNYNYYENCGATQVGELVDDQCTLEHYFVCSAYLYRTQTVKLQVKSDQSVLDPAIQSLILELINQKLQENGMLVNTTVKWKMQPDGSIFYKKVEDKNSP